MEPAFSSLRQAAAFALLLLALLLLPVLIGARALPPREQIYSAIPWHLGAFPYIHQVTYEEKGDIDIALLGDSILYFGVDTPYLEAELSKALGRKANVVTLAWVWSGADPLYFITQDLLRNRKVRMIVLVDVMQDSNENPQAAAPYLFRYGDDGDVIKGLPPKAVSQFYFASILGVPRNLLSLIRPNLADYTFSSERLRIPGIHSGALNPADRLGSLPVELDFHGAPFVDYTPATQASPADVLVYSPATANQFQFSKEPIGPVQLKFARRFGAVAAMHDTRLVLLQIPRRDQLSVAAIPFRANWQDMLGRDVPTIGIPPAKVFSGISPGDMDKLFVDDSHFNKNGQAYFTKLITPALLNLYETQAFH